MRVRNFSVAALAISCIRVITSCGGGGDTSSTPPPTAIGMALSATTLTVPQDGVTTRSVDVTVIPPRAITRIVQMEITLPGYGVTFLELK